MNTHFSIFLLLLPASYAESAFYRCDINGAATYQATPCVAGSAKVVAVQDMSVGSFDTSRHLPTSRKSPSYRTSSSKKSKTKLASKSKCWSKSRSLEDTNNRLRRGYTVGQGKRLKDKRRKQEDYLRTFCR